MTFPGKSTLGSSGDISKQQSSKKSMGRGAGMTLIPLEGPWISGGSSQRQSSLSPAAFPIFLADFFLQIRRKEKNFGKQRFGEGGGIFPPSQLSLLLLLISTSNPGILRGSQAKKWHPLKLKKFQKRLFKFMENTGIFPLPKTQIINNQKTKLHKNTQKRT